ncbi:MAG: CBS domain-containing protein [Actinobacteria bacterium]|nr:CBS domain-containing protein [Actinomycetota bacterium]
MRARDVMTTPVVTVRPSTHLKEVAALLLDRGISAVPVVDEDGELVGIVSEGDLVRLETVPAPQSHAIPMRRHVVDAPRLVEEVMTREVVTLPPEADVADVARLMLARRVKRIPIVEGRRVVGIVSRRDILKVLARPDAGIRQEVEALLDDEIVVLGRWTVGVADGIVTLTGEGDRRDRRLAELLARSVPGVVAVRFGEERDAS